VLGGSRDAHMLSGYIVVQGLRFLTRHRYVRGEDGRPQHLMTVSVDLPDYKLR
jgi:hypothetical protein